MSDKRSFTIIEEGTHYEFPIYRVIPEKGIEKTENTHCLRFVRGSKLKEEDVPTREGTLHEHVLSTMIHDLRYKNNLLPSRETSLAITHLQEALHWIEERQRARESAQVNGTYKPHSS